MSRINNRWPLAREGFPFILIGLFLTFLIYFLGLIYLSILVGILSLFTIYFFRDPKRKSEAPHNAVLTPADGTVLDIKHLEDGNNPLGKKAIKVSIFMSVFNVHVNRMPVGGTVENITYRPGRFFSANLDKASQYNENNRVTLRTPDSRRIVVIQIAGLIARRIACWINEKDHVVAGQRFGLIRFGSRLEVFLPVDSKITTRPHQKVKAGQTIIGYLS
jgi:phosphatidylserine decarboxylase